ncbi:MBL fold metallo-hydrolase [Sulfitobacter sp. D35]|uniref:MBL fold metallo-hydrolase n=1 Tax=Sulfitobacter sp. D35 TaxID=3083252 RepID=UPI00296FAC41|nr:MBL fold metallo-hydrolase [Sulfitobacter sp. D35]MDW4498745.1 MBL fold metallo-hydrolase [Sulfitobacter sp. D35]
MTSVTRRTVLGTGLASGALLFVPRLLHAQIDLGAARVDVVSDGSLRLPGSFVFDPMPQDELAVLLARTGTDPAALAPPCNVTLLRHDGRTVLFDVGAGPNFQPTAGALQTSLDAIGVQPGDVTDVVFTHAHPDHLWGLSDDFGDPLFPNARYMIGQDEWDYWTDPTTVETIGADRQSFAVGAERRLREIEPDLTVFGDGAEILPGVAARASFGHTPGHMSFEIAVNGSVLMVVGDAIGNDHVALARPSWPSGADQDMARGAETRVALVNEIAERQIPMIGFHFEGGLGRIEKGADGFVFRTDL